MYSKKVEMAVWIVGILFSVCPNTVLAEAVNWTGFAATNNNWSDPQNWSSDPFLPQSGDDVFHLNADLILMNVGTSQSPILIRSFTMDPASGGGMTIQASRALSVTTDFLPTVTPQAGAFYFLFLEAGSGLTVTNTIAHVDASLAAGIPGSATSLGATRIDASRGNVLSLGFVATESMDLRDAYPYTDWTFSGTTAVQIELSILGAREWTMLGSSRLLTNNGPYEFDRLNILEQSEFLAGFGTSILFINELFRIEGLVDLAEKLALVASAGSVVEIVNGASASFENTPGATTGAELETLRYGLPAVLSNRFAASGGIRLRGDMATISKLEGPGSVLALFVAGGDLEIESRIHNEASDWDTSGVDLQLRNVGFGNLSEVFSPDFDGIWFADSPCIKPWKSLFVDCIGVGCQATVLVDAVKNSLPLGFPWIEAMYVDGDVTVSEHATLDPNEIFVYFTGTYSGQDPGAADETRFQHEEKTLYGDFNGDCALTPIELLHLQQIISGTNPYDPLYDFDCDGVINARREKAQWLDNWFNGVFPCAPQGATAGPGTALTDEELAGLAEWIASDMTVAELVELVDLLYTKARLQAGTPLGSEITALADKLADRG